MSKNILLHSDFFPPSYNAGAERYVFTILKYLQDKGHNVKVLTQPSMGPSYYEYGGISVYTDDSKEAELYEEADFVMTQIAWTKKVNTLCKKYKKKFVYLIHNNASVQYWEVKPEDTWMAVFNADWIRKHHEETLKWKPDNSFTLYPPVMFDRYFIQDEVTVSERKYITLVNLSKNKGVLTLINAAKMLPEYDFMGVIGAYDEQHFKGLPKNIKIVKHTSNMVEDVYSKTKVLMMPSLKETWGMVAIEGFCSGIPCIANPTPGLIEACGSAGLFVQRDRAYVWQDTIRKLMEDPEYYERQSNKCLNRALELSLLAEKQLADLEEILNA